MIWGYLEYILSLKEGQFLGCFNALYKSSTSGTTRMDAGGRAMQLG